MGIFINYGTDPAAMTQELMRSADVASLLGDVRRVTIKPNLVVARPAAGGATTHPEIVEGIILYLNEHGISDIAIAEGSWVGADTMRAFEVCGYTALAKKYGVRLIDTKRDKAILVKSDYCDDLKICESAIDTDFLINVPVLKGHCQTGLTCCLKNLKGVIPDSEKRRYHSAGLMEPIAALGGAIKPQLHIIDSICGDLDFEEGGNPVEANRILLGFDGVLLDSYCASLIGYHADDIGYLRLARERATRANATWSAHDAGLLEIIEFNSKNKPIMQRKRFDSGAYASMIEADGACSACYAALVYALRQTGNPGKLRKKTGASLEGSKIKIGQGFRGKKLAGVGSGDCVSGCKAYVRGCPPSALDIVEFLTTI